MAALALEVVRAARVLPSKAAAVERALVTEAQRLAPTPERIRSLIQAGRLEARLAEAWLAAIKKPATKRPGKPKDLRLPRKPPASAGDA